MTDVTTNPDRKTFVDDLRSHVNDIGVMSKWVMTTADFPVPVRDFSPTIWTHYVHDDAEFGRLAAVLGRGAPVEFDETDGGYRLCRRRFGSVVVELWQSRREQAD